MSGNLPTGNDLLKSKETEIIFMWEGVQKVKRMCMRQSHRHLDEMSDETSQVNQ